jgi:hypothetical protein
MKNETTIDRRDVSLVGHHWRALDSLHFVVSSAISERNTSSRQKSRGFL